MILTGLSVALLGGCHRPISKEQKALRADLNRALREQSFERAATLARKALETTPQDDGLWDRLVQSEFALGDLDGAKRVLVTWRVAVEKPSSKVDEYAGDVAMAENDSAGALQYWSQALRTTPDNVRLLGKMARAENAVGHWDAENAALSKVIEAKDSAIARVNRALCRRRLHHWEDAFDDYHRARELAPEDPEVIRAGKLFQRLEGLLAEIRELDARLVLSPNDAGLFTDRAALFLRAEDFKAALGDCASAITAQPSAVRPRLLAATAHLQAGQSGEAEAMGLCGSPRWQSFSAEFIQTLARLDSDISAETDNAELYSNRAWHLNDVGQPNLALRDAQRALELNPHSASAEAEAGYASMKLGRAPAAFEFVKRATEEDPHFSTAWQYRGELEMQRRDFSAAVESFTRGLAITQTAAGLAKREQCYRELGLVVKADEDRRVLADMNARGIK